MRGELECFSSSIDQLVARSNIIKEHITFAKLGMRHEGAVQ